MKTLSIAGRLAPLKKDGITPRTRNRIQEAAGANDLLGILNAAVWDYGIVEAHSLVRVDATADSETAVLDYINRFKNFLWQVGIWELGLQGEILLTISGETPVVFRVLVHDSELTYQKGKLTWESVPSASNKVI